jgi:hypothetical protein
MDKYVLMVNAQLVQLLKAANKHMEVHLNVVMVLVRITNAVLKMIALLIYFV